MKSVEQLELSEKREELCAEVERRRSRMEANHAVHALEHELSALDSEMQQHTAEVRSLADRRTQLLTAIQQLTQQATRQITQHHIPDKNASGESSAPRKEKHTPPEKDPDIALKKAQYASFLLSLSFLTGSIATSFLPLKFKQIPPFQQFLPNQTSACLVR